MTDSRLSESEFLEVVSVLNEEARAERQMAAKARRKLRQWALVLHQKNGRYTVADHLGCGRDMPFRAPIEIVLSWIAEKERPHA